MAHEGSFNLLQCNHTHEQCLGGVFCADGHSGILCEDCDADGGYVRTSPFACGLCDARAKVITLFVVGIVLAAAMSFYNVHSNRTERLREVKSLIAKIVGKYLIALRDNGPVLVKILVTHAQVVSILLSLDIKYPAEVTQVLSALGSSVQSLSDQFSCVLNLDGLHRAYQQVVFNHVSVLCSFALIVVVLGVLKFTSDVKFGEYFGGITINLLIFVLPGMINQLIPLLSQRRIAGLDGVVFTEQEIGIVWGSPQFRYSYTLVLPLLAFWMLVFGVIVYEILRNGELQFETIGVGHAERVRAALHFRMFYGNLISGYHRERYWWEAVLMALKLGLIMLGREEWLSGE